MNKCIIYLLILFLFFRSYTGKNGDNPTGENRNEIKQKQTEIAEDSVRVTYVSTLAGGWKSVCRSELKTKINNRLAAAPCTRMKNKINILL